MLTVDDLHATLADERHLGFGYACCDVLPPGKRERLDRAIVAVANQLELDRETLFHWSNSKHGRWLADAAYGRDEPATRATVRTLLNPEAVAASLPDETHTHRYGEWEFAGPLFRGQERRYCECGSFQTRRWKAGAA
jgi:hypothetical protein